MLFTVRPVLYVSPTLDETVHLHRMEILCKCDVYVTFTYIYIFLQFCKCRIYTMRRSLICTTEAMNGQMQQYAIWRKYSHWSTRVCMT